MAKKRKGVPPSGTLHDFFGRPDRTTPAKKPRPSPITPRKAVRKYNGAPSDIIVIDDSDDEQRSPGAPEHAEQVPEASGSAVVVGRATLSRVVSAAKPPDSGDILVIEDSDSEDDGPSTRRTRAASAKPSHSVLHTQLNANEAIPPMDETHIESALSFGQPTLLLDADAQLPTNDITGDSGFGEPVLLLDSGHGETVPLRQSEPPPFDGDVVCPSPQVQQANEGSAISDVQTLETPANEWGTGDDEMDLANTEPAVTPDDELDVQLGESRQLDVTDENAIEICPICDMVLADMSYARVQEHVNACIDGATTAEAPARQPSEPKPLRPLSSLRTPEITPCKDERVKPPTASKTPGAFSVLMTSHKENEAWKEAAEAEDRNFRPTKANGGRRKAPFYKVMQGMPIAVDAFRYGSIPYVTAYFLTHAHSDHYTNLSANWKNGPIYCSEGTANLIVLMLGVDRKWVHPLPMNVATVIPDTGGVTCTPIEANHCPGSCLFLFEGVQTVNAGDSAYKSPFVGSKRVFRYLHCGDFRASPQHVNHPSIKGKHIDHVYLDTTYLDPKYCFPPQSQVITACAELARRLVVGESTTTHGSKQGGKVDGWFAKTFKSKREDDEKPAGKVLIVVGTYSIGKERIVKAIAKALNAKVYSDTRKTAILRCQSDSELESLLTSDPLEAGIHLLPLGTIASDKLKIYLERYKGHFSKVIGFRPTGWTFSAPSGTETLPAIHSVIARSQAKSFTHANLNPMKNSTSMLQMYGVPYSEHSSFFELTCFALSLDWGRMIATVNVGSETSRGKMSKWVERWDAERKKRGKGEIVTPRDPDFW